MTMLTEFAGSVGKRFIETGTNLGNTLEHALDQFEECVSIEQNQRLYDQARARLGDRKNVTLIHGDSSFALPYVIRDVPTTFWLDAHYMEDGNTRGPTGQCPLLAELRAITAFKWTANHQILIDDAFMFDDRIPHPGFKYPFWTSNESNHTAYYRPDWPTIEQIDEILRAYKKSMHSEFILRYDSQI